MASKTTFLQQALDACTKLAQISDKCETLLEVWLTRGYAQGAPAEISQADVDEAFGLNSGITVESVRNFAFLMDQFQKFRTNQAIAQGDYTATLNTLRSDV